MSETVAYTGTITPVDVGDKTPLEWLKEKHNTDSDYDTVKELLDYEDLTDKYVFADGTLYAIKKQKEHPEEIAVFRPNSDGSIDFMCVYYNGATTLSEIIEESI